MHANYGYTYWSAQDSAAVCHYWLRHHQVRLAPSEVGLLPSVVSGLRVCVEQFTLPGEGVILQSPVYGPFHSAVKDLGRRVLDAPLRRDDRGSYHMDLEAVEDHLRQGARMMLFCSPHNPVSRCWTEGEIGTLLAILRRYRATLVSDEIHADFVYAPGQFYSLMRVADPGTQVITLAAASKTFNIAGLKQASIFCRQPEVLGSISQKLEKNGVEAGSIFGLVGTRVALKDCDDWLAGALAYLDHNRGVLAASLARLLPAAVLTPIEATFLAWVDLRAYGLSNEELMPRFRREGVLPTDGGFFGRETGEGFMRLNFGCPTAQLEEGLERFARAVKG